MPKKRALLCAINDYGDPRNNLPSCLADADAFKQLLKASYGFADGDIREIYDGAATVPGLRAGLQWLFENPDANDRLVFYYSGHGYQRPENGVLEEMLVLRGESGGIDFFKDDELSSSTQDLPPGCLTVISDSCYSGGMEKAVLFPAAGVEVVRSKVYQPTVDEQRQKADAITKGEIKRFKPFLAAPTSDVAEISKDLAPFLSANGSLGLSKAGVDDEPTQVQMNGMLLSACLADETAAASSARTGGLSAFTYALLGVLSGPESEGPEVGPQNSTADIFQATKSRLAREGFRQTPMFKVPHSPAGMGSRSFILLGDAAPVGTATQPTQPTTTPSSGGGWMSQLQDALQSMFPKAPTTPTKGADVATATMDKGWGDLIPMIPRIVNLGMDVYHTVTKEGLVPADKDIMPAGASEEEREKWIELIPQLITFGSQVYDALSKEGMLPPEKSVDTSAPVTLQEPEKWIELIPQFVSIGLDVYNSLKSKGFVAQHKAAALPANTSEQEAQKWLSLIPVAVSVGLEVYNALKSKDLILDANGAAAKAVSVPSAATAATGDQDVMASAVHKALEKSGFVYAG
jgi:hypothetical protein